MQKKKSAGEKWTNPRKSALKKKKKKLKASRCFYATCMWFFPTLHTLRAVNSELQLPQRSWNVYGFVLKCLCTHARTHTHSTSHQNATPYHHHHCTPSQGSAGITELCWRPFFNSLTHQSFRSSAVHKASFLSKGGGGKKKKAFQYWGRTSVGGGKVSKESVIAPQSERFSSVGQCPIRGCVKLVSRVVVEIK